MSKLVPRATIDVLRGVVDVILNQAIGMDCTIYIPTTSSLTSAEGLDIFEKPSDLAFTPYSSSCFIVWNPSKYRLRKLGIFVENEIPILVWLPNTATALEGSEQGQVVDIDVVQKSYIRIAPEMIPGKYQNVQELEVVDVIVKGMHDAIIYKGYKCVPRRVVI